MELPSNLTKQLYQAWQQAIADNKLINDFRAVEDDPDGRWVKGDEIAFGIQRLGDQHVYYAQNHTQGLTIQSAVEEKTIDEIDFICQFNGYRALRPGGQWKALGRQPGIPANAEQCRFSCQDPTHSLSLLVRTPLIQVRLQHFDWLAFYNAAPIDPNGHFLWIPKPLGDPHGTLHHFPQYLTQELLEDALVLFRTFHQTIFFFNSLHAGASVNHIHFQALYHGSVLAAEKYTIKDFGSYSLLDGHPAKVLAFSKATSCEKIFDWVHQFQKNSIPFNLMLLGDRIILIPRNIDHEIVSEFPGNGLAALGMSGKIVTIDPEAYANATRERIEKAFKKMALDW
jgi:diadenosine tetraphosphate (Ap4A) HIT family hydrolase